MVNLVLNTLGRVFQSSTPRRHSTAVTCGNELLNSSWEYSGSNSKQGSSANVLSTSSSYVLLESSMNNDRSGSGGEGFGGCERRVTYTGSLLTVPDSSPIVQRKTTGGGSGKDLSELLGEGRPRREEGGNGDGKTRSRSAGRKCRQQRKQSLASTILNMIANPATPPRGGRRHQRNLNNFKQQRSFDAPRPPAADQEQHKFEHSIQQKKGEQQCSQKQRYLKQQYSYSGEAEVMLMDPNDVIDYDDDSYHRPLIDFEGGSRKGSYCIVRRKNVSTSTKNTTADRHANSSSSPRVATNDEATRRRPPPQSMKSQEIVEIFHSSFGLNPQAMGSQSCDKPAQTVLFGFCSSPTAAGTGSSSKNFQKANVGLEKAMADFNLICSTHIDQSLLLRCIDPVPLHSFMHYGLFNVAPPSVRSRSPSQSPSSASPPNSHHLSRSRSIDCNSANSFWQAKMQEMAHTCPNINFGTYVEVSAIQKTIANEQLPSLATMRHSGYIIICFKLLEDNCKQRSLEKSWFAWSGANEISKHSPMTWSLRRIILYRQCSPSAATTISTGNINAFAYILTCEFGNILHPNNKLAALDMCERLRARNCGHIGLYQVQNCHSSASYGNNIVSAGSGPPSTSSSTANTPYYNMSLSCRANNNSNHSSASSANSQNNLQQQQQNSLIISPWQSPKQRLTPAEQRRSIMMARGYSLEPDATYRRAAFNRIRDRSLEPESTTMSSEEFLLMSQFGATSLNNTPPSRGSLTPPNAHFHPPSLPFSGRGGGGFHQHQFNNHQSLSNV